MYEHSLLVLAVAVLWSKSSLFDFLLLYPTDRWPEVMRVLRCLQCSSFWIGLIMYFDWKVAVLASFYGFIVSLISSHFEIKSDYLEKLTLDLETEIALRIDDEVDKENIN